MRFKPFLFLGIFALFAAGISVASAAVPRFETDLYYGIRGSEEVTRLQQFLTEEQVYNGPITGNFFTLTRDGVKAFQARENIRPVAGYAGPLTRARINQILAIRELPQMPTIPEIPGVSPSFPPTSTPPVPVPTSTPSIPPPPAFVPLPVTIEPVFPISATQAGTSVEIVIGTVKVTNNGASPIYLDTVRFSNSGNATTSTDFALYASQSGGTSGDSSVTYDNAAGVNGASASIPFDISGVASINKRIDGGSWRYLTVKTTAVSANNDTYALGVSNLGDVTYAVLESDLGYNANPSVNSTLTDTITGLPASGTFSLGTLTARQ